MPQGHSPEFMAQMRKKRWDRDCANPIKNFWDKINVGDNAECWPWKRQTKTVYPRTSIDRWKTVQSANRIAWILTNKKPVPEGMFVCHSCDNPQCCNPNHLFLGTAQDNVDDMIRKGRHKFHTGKNAPWYGKFGSKHNTSKLTENEVVQMRRLYKPHHFTQKMLAKKYGVSVGCITAIIYRKVWNHI